MDKKGFKNGLRKENLITPLFIAGIIFQDTKLFCIPRALIIQTFHTSFLLNNNLCKFTALEHKFKS